MFVSSWIGTFLWIGMIVLFITLLIDLAETSRARRDAHLIREVLSRLEIDKPDQH